MRWIAWGWNRFSGWKCTGWRKKPLKHRLFYSQTAQPWKNFDNMNFSTKLNVSSRKERINSRIHSITRIGFWWIKRISKERFKSTNTKNKAYSSPCSVKKSLKDVKWPSSPNKKPESKNWMKNLKESDISAKKGFSSNKKRKFFSTQATGGSWSTLQNSRFSPMIGWLKVRLLQSCSIISTSVSLWFFRRSKNISISCKWPIHTESSRTCHTPKPRS